MTDNPTTADPPSSLTVERSSLPLVSVLLAVSNEARHLSRCLDALVAQTWPGDRFELIVADGRSDDGSGEVVRAYAHRLNLTVVDNPARITPAGFNRALAAARGEVVIILGARTQVAADFIEQSMAALATSGADAAGGVVESAPMADADSPTARAVALALRSPFGVGGARYRYAASGGWVDTVNYGAYRRAVFERIGGFDETMTWVEDDEFNYRLRAAGGRLWLEPAVRVRYFARPTLAALWRQQFRWGFNKPKVARRHPAQMRPRHAVPALFVGTVVGGAAASTILRPARWLLVGVLAAYTLATMVATAVTARQISREEPAEAGGGRDPAAPDDGRIDGCMAAPAPVTTTEMEAGDRAVTSPAGAAPQDLHRSTRRGTALPMLRAGSPRQFTITAWSGGIARSSVLARLPLAFATMHIAYGSGMLLGLLRELCIRNRPAAVPPPPRAPGQSEQVRHA